MGLPGPALNPQDSFIAVEFDTSSDPSLADNNGNHIGVDVNTVISFASVDAESIGIDLIKWETDYSLDWVHRCSKVDSGLG